MTPGQKSRQRAKTLTDKRYFKKLAKLQIDLVKMQEWIVKHKMKVVVIFEGRDAAGKGGVITRITQNLNPRVCRVVALGKPTRRERSQWYFQRYVSQLPAAGEMVIFDRSWYNRAGVERVMQFATEDEVHEFLRTCPAFEDMLVRSGIRLIKYWFDVGDDEQERRFQERITKPTKRWKLSAMDLASRAHWFDYTQAYDEMFEATDQKHAPWYIVKADDKRRARLNCIRHLLSQSPCPYQKVKPRVFKVPPRQKPSGYVSAPKLKRRVVPDIY